MQQQSELVVSLRVALRMACELAAVLVVIGPLREVITIHKRGERAFKRQDLQPVLRQLELADDLGPQQAHDIGKDREAEAREHFLAHRRAADALAPLEYKNLAPRAREIGGAGETVVAAADDDGVVALHALFRGGSKNGFFTTRAAVRLRRCSTVISISRAVPGAVQRVGTCASAMYFFSSGDHAPLVQ